MNPSGDTEDFSQLKLLDKLGHSSWKARKMGYSELSREFKECDRSNQLDMQSKYLGHLKRMVVESNMAGLESALECIESYLQYIPNTAEYAFDLFLPD